MYPDTGGMVYVMIVKYLTVGVLNTLVTLLTIFTCTYIFEIDYYLSYFIGYIVGIINSFIFNKFYTFSSNSPWVNEFTQFILRLIISYVVSHVSLIVLIDVVLINKDIAVIVSMVIYTAMSFILLKNIFLKDTFNIKKI